MRGKKLMAAFAIGSGAAALLAGSAAAAPRSAPSQSSGGAVQLLDYANNDAAVTSVIITGKIGDLGTATSIAPDGTIAADHNELNLALSHGSFRIDTAALDRAFLGAVSRAPFYPSNNTCSGSVSATAPAPIVPGSGTGAYQGHHRRVHPHDLSRRGRREDHRPGLPLQRHGSPPRRDNLHQRPRNDLIPLTTNRHTTATEGQATTKPEAGPHAGPGAFPRRDRGRRRRHDEAPRRLGVPNLRLPR